MGLENEEESSTTARAMEKNLFGKFYQIGKKPKRKKLSPQHLPSQQYFEINNLINQNDEVSTSIPEDLVTQQYEARSG